MFRQVMKCPFAELIQEKNENSNRERKKALAAAGKDIFGSSGNLDLLASMDRIENDDVHTLASIGKKLFESGGNLDSLTDVRFQDQFKQKWISKANIQPIANDHPDFIYLQQLRKHLPLTLQEKSLVPLFQMNRHGASILTLYDFVRHRGPTWILLHTLQNEVLGAFCSVSWSDSKNRYFGTGQCFLFSFSNDSASVYKWTKKNNYFMIGGHDYIALGGGNGAFGLYLNADFSQCRTESCLTYENKPLVLHPTFSCKQVVMYGFASS